MSGIQHRQVVGMNNRCRGMSTVNRKYQSKFIYRFNNLAKTILSIMSDYSRNNYYVYGPATVLYILLSYCFIICMLSSLSMQVDISVLADAQIKYPSTFLASTNNVVFSCLINWAVVMLYFSQSSYSGANIFYQCFKQAKYSLKSTKLKKLENSLSYYITLLNLLLIVLVTPSIINPGPAQQSDLKIGYCNVQGLVLPSSMKSQMPIFQTNKLLDIQSYVYTHDLDVVIFNESWLTKYIGDNEIFNDEHYKIFRLDRSEKDKIKYNKVGGGGLFIIIKQSLSIESRVVTLDTDVPILSIELKFPDASKVCISTFYRYGYSSMDMFEDVKTYYETLSIKYSKIHLIGDLNLSTVSDWRNPCTTCSLELKYIELFQNLGLVPQIYSATHRGGKTLDQLLTNQPHLINNIQTLYPTNSVTQIITQSYLI